MNKAIAFFTLAVFFCQSESFVSAQSADSEPLAHPRVARLESSPLGQPTPVDMDLDADPSSTPSTFDDSALISFDEGSSSQPVLDERKAEIEEKLLSNAVRILGFATLCIFAAIAGLIIYGSKRQRLQRSRDW